MSESISQFPAASQANPTDLVPATQGSIGPGTGNTRTITPVQIVDAGMLNEGTTTTVLHGNAAGAPAFSAVNLATDVTGLLNLATNVSGSLPIANGGTGFSAFLRGYIGGLTLANDSGSPNTIIDISAGICADSTNSVGIVGTALTKSTGGTWVAGSGANGLGQGLTIAASTWYHVFAIINGNAADVYFDTSVTAANKPAGTTAFRRIGSFLTDGSSHIIPFSQNGNEFLWLTTLHDGSNLAPGVTTAESLTVSSPLGVICNVLFRAYLTDGSSLDNIIFTSFSENDQAPNGAGTAGASLAVIANGVSGGEFNKRTNTSSQIRYRLLQSTGTAQVQTFGYIDTRGQFL